MTAGAGALGRALAGLVSGWLRETRGAAAVEFSLWAALLILPVLNVVDVGVYLFQSMQVKEAAQVAAQAAWVSCDPTKGYLPAATNCPSLQTTLATAAHSTSLGSNAAVQTSHEYYYCPTTANTLTEVDTTSGVINTSGSNTAPVAPSPDTCVASTGGTAAPGDYVAITVNYTYKSVFSGASVVSLLPATISQTALMRLG
jgi:Flp pilus assembly protein TadG